MRMAGANPNPDYFRRSFRRKSTDALDGKEKGSKLNRVKSFPQSELNRFGNIREKTEREMHLIAHCPAYAAKVWIEIDQNVSDRFWRIDRNKESA